MPRRFKRYPVRDIVVTSRWRSAERPDHNGVDFDLSTGDPLFAVDDGVVSFILRDASKSSGLAVGIRRDDGVDWSYSHMSRIDVAVGQKVRAGDVIGAGGKTGRVIGRNPADPDSGSHLHFRVNVNGSDVDPFDLLPPADVVDDDTGGGIGGAEVIGAGALAWGSWAIIRALFPGKPDA